MIDRTSGEPAHAVAIEHGDCGAASLPLLSPTRCGGDISGSESRLDPAAATRFAFDAVTRDEIEHHGGRAAGDAHQVLAGFRAEHRDQFVRIVFQSRDDLAAIAAGCAPAGLTGL